MAVEQADARRDRRIHRIGTTFDRWVVSWLGFPRWAAVAIIAGLLVVCWIAVMVSGGTQRTLPHLYYVPIILAALAFRWQGAVVTAAIATVLVGPLTPLNTATGEAQHLSGIVFRGVMFLLIGLAAALVLDLRARFTEQQISGEVREAMTAVSTAPQVDAELVPLVAGVLADRSFHPVFQPVYSLKDGRILAVEALTRFEAIPYRTPDLWFAAAQAAGHGVNLELAAIDEALRACADLPEHVALSLNASPATLSDPHLLDLVTAHPERQVIVEITEHAVVSDYHLLQATVGALRAQGIRIAVDDAGAGFSSLRHIVQLAPETIKVDISLTQGVATSPLRRALAGALVEFAQHTGAELVIEGVEESSDLTTWIGLGADAAQGYLVGRPGLLPVAESSEVIWSVLNSRV